MNGKWIRIDDELPEIGLDNLDSGSVKVKVRHRDGSLNYMDVYDPIFWVQIAKKEGVTHWLKLE
jgi:hypothetical protein